MNKFLNLTFAIMAISCVYMSVVTKNNQATIAWVLVLITYIRAELILSKNNDTNSYYIDSFFYDSQERLHI